MKLWAKRFIAILMAVILTAPFLHIEASEIVNGDTGLSAVEAYNEVQVITDAGNPAPADSTEAVKTTPVLPVKYDSRDFGYISPVRYQGSYGTCWAHGVMGACEANMVKNGIKVGNEPADVDTINLSESHLAFFSYTDSYDELGLLAGDKVTLPEGCADFLDFGGHALMSAFVLMRWTGLTSEETPGLAYEDITYAGLSPDLAYTANMAHVQDCTWVPVGERDSVKALIMEYGAGTMPYVCDNFKYYNIETSAYYCPDEVDPWEDIQKYYEQSYHAVTIVGWDDTYSKSNFRSDNQPQNDGAWIVKGSWSEAFGIDGYYYISYEDVGSLGEHAVFYGVESVDNYKHNYQYDGTNGYVGAQPLQSGTSVANLFTASGPQEIEAAAIAVEIGNVSYTCNIYTGITAKGFSSTSRVAATVSGTFEYSGYHTVKFDEPVHVDEGDRFAVVFTLYKEGGTGDVYPMYDCSTAYYMADIDHAWHEGVSYVRRPSSVYASTWEELGGERNYRIKAYTNDATYSMTARSADEELGSVLVVQGKYEPIPRPGYLLITQPQPGYAACGYRIISGHAEVTENENGGGKIYYVIAQDHCVIEIQFMRVPYAITFSVPATVTPPDMIPVYRGDSVTMPTLTNLPQGNTFVGWREMSDTISPTEEKPYCMAPGYTYDNVFGDTIFYAVFSFPSPTDSSVTLYSTRLAPCSQHDYEETSRKEPTCYLTGMVYYKCRICGATYNEVLDKYQHILTDWVVEREATFSAAGSRYQKCALCIFRNYEVIPKLSWVNPFRDVNKRAWYYDAVRYVNYYGYIKGTNDGSTFEPDTVTTRAMFVNILYRLEKDPAAHDNRFTDVPNGAWYEPGISWAAGERVVNGTSSTTFSPNGSLDRQQMATMLYNYAKYKGQNMDATGDYTEFRDGADVDNWAQTPINWALGRSLISGTSETDKILSPNGKATRATIAVILMNFLKT